MCLIDLKKRDRLLCYREIYHNNENVCVFMKCGRRCAGVVGSSVEKAVGFIMKQVECTNDVSHSISLTLRSTEFGKSKSILRRNGLASLSGP